MRIRIGHNCILIQHRQPPVHWRIGRKPRLHRKNMGQHIFKTLFEGIKPRTGTQNGKVGRPDMRRNEQHIFTSLQTNLYQVSAIQPQDRSPVRLQVSNCIQPGVQPRHRLKIRHQHHVMNLPRLVVLLVDQADLHRQQKPHLPLTRRWNLPIHRGAKGLLQLEQTFFCRFQIFLQLLKPNRMRKIPRPHHRQSLNQTPPVEIFRIQRLARRPGKPGMQMHICYKSHNRTPIVNP